MKLSKKQSWQRLHSRFEPGFRRMLLLSVAIHFLLPAFYTGLLYLSPPKEKPPVYRVNLVNKPVKNPQAGRPEAAPKKQEAVKKAPPKPAPKPVVKPKPKPAPKPKPTPVEKPKPAPKPKPVVTKADEQSLAEKIDKMRRQKEREDRIAKLKEDLARERDKVVSPVVDAPVGEMTGKGDEEGVAFASYVKAYITEQWRYSPYLGNNLNFEAVWVLVYSAEGQLINKKVIAKSGNRAFDDSLLRAILKSQDLGRELGERTEFEVTFNLREMQN
ncbi:MAG: TonB C-terminal domain-containing protein [Desulfuromonadales bacterium]|nr:TonB C-terminal domain-containing protein [Desulfuromonadales bacterium]